MIRIFANTQFFHSSRYFGASERSGHSGSAQNKIRKEAPRYARTHFIRGRRRIRSDNCSSADKCELQKEGESVRRSARQRKFHHTQSAASLQAERKAHRPVRKRE